MRMENKIIFYGATWCRDCKQSQAYLEGHHIPFTYINIDDVPEAAEKVKQMNDGFASVPTIIFPDGQVLVEPSDQLLAETIEANKEILHN